MALNSTGTPSTVLVSWTPHLRGASSSLTPTGRSYRANHRVPIYAPSFRQCFQIAMLSLIKEAIRLYRKSGLLAVSLKLQRKETVRRLQLRSYRWRLKWKTYPLSLSNTTQRMYWRTILPQSHRAGQVRMWMNYHRVQSRVKKMFHLSQRKTAHRKFGESDDIT